MGKHLLEARNLVAGYDERAIIKGLDLTIPEGKISVIIGSNGCGKSTLLKTFCRLNKVMSGDIYLDGRPVSDYAPKEMAKIISLMPQSPLVPEGITVYDLISRGRFPYRRVFRGMDARDFKAIGEAMETMGITELRDRAVDELSGGQRQRVWIALALAQQTDILFLDEPTTFLDIAYQIDILDLLGELNRSKKTTIIMVLHDINLSVRYADYIFALKSGNLYAEGAPEKIISEKLIKDVYGLDNQVIIDPSSNAPMVVPIGKHQKSFS